eukprot:scaffold362_cov127-Isochrysis_galbana.AAC.1
MAGWPRICRGLLQTKGLGGERQAVAHPEDRERLQLTLTGVARTAPRVRRGSTAIAPRPRKWAAIGWSSQCYK